MVTRIRLITSLALPLACLLTSCVSLGPANRGPTTDLARVLEAFHDAESGQVLVAAHRGLHTQYPENLLGAIEHAIAAGVDIVELDVRTTRDGVLVLMHDDTIDRTTMGRGHVAELDYDEIAAYRLTRYGLPTIWVVPTLEEALAAACGRILVDLDVKDACPEGLLDVVGRTGTLRQVVFFSSDTELLDGLLALEPDAMVMPRAHSAVEAEELLKRYRPPVLHLDPEFCTKALADQIKASGSRVWLNALGFADLLAKWLRCSGGYDVLLRTGVNVVQTDASRVMLDYLRAKCRHW